jgi:glycosyl transferase family 25
MKIFVISLRGEQARRAYVQRELSDAGLPFRFFDAIEGTVAEQHFAAIRPWSFLINARRRPTLGEIGCYASHRSLWRHCIELGEPILVLEDDCELAANFAAALKRIEALTRKYGFVRLAQDQAAPAHLPDP